MKTIIAIAVAGALLAPGLASAAPEAWKIVAVVGGQTVPVNCTLSRDGDALSGTCARADGSETPVPATGSVNGSDVKLAYDVKFQDMPLHIAYTGTLQSDGSVSGSIDVAGQTGTFTASK